MHLEVAPEVLELDQLGQPVRARQRDLPPGFAQLRGHKVQAQLGVDLLLRLPGHPARAFEEAVLVQLVALLLRDGAQLDVVRFGAREVLQCSAIGGGLDGAEVHLEAAAQLHRGAGRALGDDLRHLAVIHESLHHLRAVARRDHHVQVADRFAPPAVAPRHLDFVDATARLQVRDDRLGLDLGFVQEHAALRDLGLAQPDADLLLHLGAEAFELGYLAGRERFREIGGGSDLELREQQLDALGTEAGDAEQIEQAGGELRQELFT